MIAPVQTTTSNSAVPGAGFRTHGHDTAVALIRAMIAGRTPHALLLSGPSGVGKTTLALDLAAGLLCDDPDPAVRPCRACRACRLVDRGIHPDLHRLAPSGPADQIRIGDRGRPDPGTIRRLASDLVLLPVEGGARVAILERADRMTDDAQTALLKTLEEPPAGVTIILCADDDERLMPTVRSRCRRIRLGPVAVREIEAILAAMDVADAAVAARLARIAGGRPGAARTLAIAPGALATRDEIARTLLDLLTAGPAARLVAARDLAARAADIARALDRASVETIGAENSGSATATRSSGRGSRAPVGRRAGPTVAPAGPSVPSDDGAGDAGEGDGSDAADAAPVASVSAAERRRATSIVIGVWRDLTRDLLVVLLGDERQVRDPALLDDLRAAAAALRSDSGADGSPAALSGFLARLDAVGELVEANTRPELALDSLLLGWPRGAAQ